MYGMQMMSGAMKPLANSPEFVSLLTKFENPILGICSDEGSILFSEMLKIAMAEGF